MDKNRFLKKTLNILHQIRGHHFHRLDTQRKGYLRDFKKSSQTTHLDLDVTMNMIKYLYTQDKIKCSHAEFMKKLTLEF